MHMQLRYNTERLTLVIGDPGMAPLVADYLTRNAGDFKHWERESGEEIYTIPYQEKALEAEQKLFLQGRGVRYYIFLSEDPDRIIGNVSLAYLSEDFGHRCSLGYRIDAGFRRRGYAFEACSRIIREAVPFYHIHRMEADILPENEASLALIRKLGFEYEGVARAAHSVAGVERDHLRFSYIP